MEPDDPETFAMLREAREKGEKLLAELLKHQADAEANPPKIPPEQLELGRLAMQKAIESTRRMLASLDQAQRIASLHTN
jgi:hypothetical protein